MCAPTRSHPARADTQVSPSVPQDLVTAVMMHTFPDSLRDISHANFGGQLRDFREIPGDNLARLVSQR